MTATSWTGSRPAPSCSSLATRSANTPATPTGLCTAAPVEVAKPRTEQEKPKTERSKRPMEMKLLRELERLPGKMEAATAEIAALEQTWHRRLLHPRSRRLCQDQLSAEAKRAELVGMEERWLELELMKEAAGL